MRAVFATLVLALIWLGPAPSARAQCAGTDMRPGLTEDMRAAVDAQVAQMPFAEGNHWIARRDGDVVHLVGTMHADDPRFDAVTDRLAPVIADARLLLLEVTKAEQEALMAELATDPSLFVLQDTTLPELLSEADWQALSEATAARGIPGFMAAKMKPWYLSLILALPPCMQAAMGTPNGLDARLEALAAMAGTPTAALEDPRSVFAAFEGAPLEEQAAMILPSIMPAESAEDLFATLREAYFAELTAESWVLSTTLAAELSPAGAGAVTEAMDQAEGALLTDRNRAWMSVILTALDDGGPVVVAAGAAHLPGETGLLQLLSAEGFTLTRAPF
ncbi:hypothetical protein SAMN05421759_102212 [Roseivivax lentus]|uniref:TraB family protein n=1 Tax=Roseivivax lentus TaxID=633194 RepID=A0A1N7KZ91_9RHOB|nr:TraB/GumN family protein [Roseivivax lentus]SIS66898.1 hypothetical protein SAMN05421759_102212 [Roseivivax lentus]